MNNFVRINYNGHVYVGQIITIESIWEEGISLTTGLKERALCYYKVELYEYRLGITISDIYIHDISEIVILSSRGNEDE